MVFSLLDCGISVQRMVGNTSYRVNSPDARQSHVLWGLHIISDLFPQLSYLSTRLQLWPQMINWSLSLLIRKGLLIFTWWEMLWKHHDYFNFLSTTFDKGITACKMDVGAEILSFFLAEYRIKNVWDKLSCLWNWFWNNSSQYVTGNSNWWFF